MTRPHDVAATGTWQAAAMAAIVAGMLLRLAWASWVPVMPLSDSVVYDEFARSLVAGRGFAFADGTPTAFWPVGTSALYAFVYLLWPDGFAGIVALNLLLGLGVMLLTYTVARRHCGPAVAALATGLVACWPLLIQFTTILASELLFTFLLLAVLDAWGRRGMPDALRGLVWGSLLCAAVYVRPTALPLFAVLPALELWRERRWCGALTSMSVAVVAAACLLAPWTLRNHELFGRVVLVSANFGQNLWMGNNPRSDGGYMALPSMPGLDEAQTEERLKAEALRFIRDEPLRYVALSARRLVMTYGRESIGVVWNERGLQSVGAERWVWPLKLASSAYWGAMVLLAVCGTAVLVRQRRIDLLHPLAVVGAMLFVIPVLTVGQDRYHVPLIPCVAILAALALQAWPARRGAPP